MAGVIVGSVISAGASLLGGMNSANAAKSAANTQSEASKYSADLAYQTSQQQLAAQKDALDRQIAAAGSTVDKQLVAQRDALDQQLALQKQIYENTRADLAPYRETGVAATNQLATLLGIGGNTGAANYGKYSTAEFTPEMFKAGIDPGYAFRLNEGLKAVDRQAAARGGLISGNALKASQAYGQDMASQEYQNAFNRYQTVRGNTLSPFQNLSAQGQNAAALTGTAGAQYGSAGSQAIGNYGQGASTAYGNAGSNIGTAYGNYGSNTSNVLGAYNTNATNALTGGANATASGIVGGANAYNTALGGVSNLANTYYLNSLFNNRNNAMNLPQSGFNSGYEANAGVNFASPNVYG